MTVVYMIVIFNFFHQQQGMAPERYPDLSSCQVALAQKQFGLGYWGQCHPISLYPGVR